MNRVPGCKITPHVGKIQDKDDDFYLEFDAVIAGLDNVEARRWLNAKLHHLINWETDEDGNTMPERFVPLIDGGTEGFKGHVRLFVPGVTACFECTLDAIPKQTGYALCTLQGKPRKPEHCIAYAHKLLWPRLLTLDSLEKYTMRKEGVEAKDDEGITFDSDDEIHMGWIYQRALERAKEFTIEGVTLTLTMQVVKNIIPAIASTNAIVSAGCVMECFKCITASAFTLDNWLMYMGQEGTNTNTFQ
eukprot:UN25029